MAVHDLVGILEAAYRAENDDASWLRGVVEAAEPLLDRGYGMTAYTYDARGGATPVVGAFHASPKFDPAWLAAFASIRPPEHAEDGSEIAAGWRAWMHLPCATVSSVRGLEDIEKALSGFGGARDLFAVNGHDPTRFGVVISAALPHRVQLTASTRKLYNRVATHLAAAYRIRRAGEQLPVDAVLRPDGRVVHAEGAARAHDAREALRQAALRIEKARTMAGRRDDEAATSAWQGMVDARWSLVEREAPGEPRQIVVTPNASRGADLAGLTPREMQIIGFAAVGRADRDIAYDLGLTPTTVRVAMHRVCRKLGVVSRQEVLARYASARRAASV